jgi:hypothetical protein
MGIIKSLVILILATNNREQMDFYSFLSASLYLGKISLHPGKEPLL